ncbi:MAG: HAD family hydrolase [Lachnospiraceae bacterium]
MRYKLAIFDMDGTILDTLEDLMDAVNFALEKNGFPVHSIDNVRKFVGNGMWKLIERAVPKGTSKELQIKVHDDFMDYYHIHCADKTKPYDGILDLLVVLQESGCKTAVVSNKADEAVHELCKQYFPGMFDCEIGARDGIANKPAPDSVNEVLKKLQLEKSDAVYIGDSDVDVATALNANLDSIIVTWGFRDRDFLSLQGAKVFADSTEEIRNIILES